MSSPMMNKMLGFCCCGCCTTADLTAGGINIKSKMPPNETFLKLTFISLFPLCRLLISTAVLFCCDVSGVPKAHVVPSSYRLLRNLDYLVMCLKMDRNWGSAMGQIRDDHPEKLLFK